MSDAKTASEWLLDVAIAEIERLIAELAEHRHMVSKHPDREQTPPDRTKEQMP